MQKERRELLEQSLRKMQQELEELGFVALISHSLLPHGHSMSLVVGESEVAIVAACTAQSIGEESAHVADASARERFAFELSDKIADRAITSAAAMSNTTGTITGDLEAKFGRSRAAWLRVPRGFRIAVGVANVLICLAVLAVAGYAAWMAAMQIFRLPVSPGWIFGYPAEIVEPWLVAGVGGLFTASVCLTLGWMAEDYLIDAILSAVTKRFN